MKAGRRKPLTAEAGLGALNAPLFNGICVASEGSVSVFTLDGLRSRFAHHVRAMSPERIFWSVMIVCAALFVLLLLFEPTGAGRGGR